MIKYTILFIMFVFEAVSFGTQQNSFFEIKKEPAVINQPSEMKSIFQVEMYIPPDSNHIDAFADAFADPNIVIGVFEDAAVLGLSDKVNTEERSVLLQALMNSMRTESYPLHLIKSIKGEFNKPIIYLRKAYTTSTSRRQIPSLHITPGSKWILALRKTTQESRIERWGKGIEKYNDLDNDNMFIQFRLGYGALCLKWTKPDDEGVPPMGPNSSYLFTKPTGLVEVTESMIDDLQAIQKLMPLLQKEEKDQNDIVSITKTSQALRNDLAKSIFTKLSKDKKK